MEKFRELAGDKAYICVEDEMDQEKTNIRESKGKGGISKFSADLLD